MFQVEPATFADFEREARRGNVVPVVTLLSVPNRDVLSMYEALAGDAEHAFLLESAEGGERAARYSFIGAQPEMVVRGRGDQTIIERDGECETQSIRASDFLRDYFSTRKLARRPGLGPLVAGVIGYFAYSSAYWFEAALTPEPETTTDDALFMFFRTIVAFDRVNSQVRVSSVVFTDEAEDDCTLLEQLYRRAVNEIEKVVRRLTDVSNTSPTLANVESPASAYPLRLNWTAEQFTRAVAQIKQHIAAGDCYQVVLSQKLIRKITASPLSIYAALREINPSPYMYFIRHGQETIVGASPEMLVQCRGPRLNYRPIAGTRPRGKTRADDWLLASEMRQDEKEVAEHMMLVDLGRNDLGRVADYGSVEVDELMKIETYSHVQHLVSFLRARLRDGLSCFDAFGACFPAGTVTGAPKVRAMQIIRELEPEPRGIYAGAIFYVDYANNFDSCIAIRTMVIRDGEALLQSGAGIVADSVAALEYEETLNKAQGLIRAIEIAEEQLQCVTE